MPVDRSLLPPLPGKPEWYLENAPQAVDRTADLPGLPGPPSRLAPRPSAVGAGQPAVNPVGAAPPARPAHEADAAGHPGADQPHHARKAGKVKALSGLLKH